MMRVCNIANADYRVSPIRTHKEVQAELGRRGHYIPLAQVGKIEQKAMKKIRAMIEDLEGYWE